MSDKHFDSLLDDVSRFGSDNSLLNTSCISNMSNVSFMVGRIDKDDVLDESVILQSNYLALEEIPERDREETMQIKSIDLTNFDLPRLSINSKEVIYSGSPLKIEKIPSNITFGGDKIDSPSFSPKNDKQGLDKISEETLIMISNLKSENTDLKSSITF